MDVIWVGTGFSIDILYLYLYQEGVVYPLLFLELFNAQGKAPETVGL